jgi:hypothetical protein
MLEHMQMPHRIAVQYQSGAESDNRNRREVGINSQQGQQAEDNTGGTNQENGGQTVAAEMVDGSSFRAGWKY